MKIHDYIVVGSGCSGAIAAQTLVESGVDVTMLDTGIINKDDNSIPKDESFYSLRNNDPDQYKYFIGDKGQGLSWGKISKGAQVTPPRQYITKHVDKLTPIKSRTFSPLESLSYGGLGLGWGLQCWAYSDSDIQKVGLEAPRVREAYEVIAKRIGISATKDSAAKYTIGNLQNYQKSANEDRNHRLILNKYAKQQKKLQGKGIFIGRTPLALITSKVNGRKEYRYLETDFYSDADKSAWRPWITVDRLRRKKNFTYIGDTLVTSFKEKGDIVEVHTINIENNKNIIFKCRNLILASGALGTARIVLRSQAKEGVKVPLLSNPHSYIPCIQPRMLGKGYEKKKLGFGQVSYFIDTEGNDSGLSVASSYSYQSLMLFRIINQLPLNFADGRIISRFLTPGLVIMIAQHPDSQSPNKYLRLVKDKSSVTGDRMEAKYTPSQDEEETWDKREREYVSAMRKLGTYPLKRVKTEHGSAIHYAGTLPFSEKPKPLHLDKSGRLHKTKHVYIADSSGFLFLPGKGLTFTLMANAHIVACNVLKEHQ